MDQSQKALNTLKNALSKLWKSVEKCWKILLNCLAKKEKLSVADEMWLDNARNLVDEECVIESLDAASDFEQGVEQLSETGKAALHQLRQAAGEEVSKKWKCRFISIMKWIQNSMTYEMQHAYLTDSDTVQEPKPPCNQMLHWPIPIPHL